MARHTVNALGSPLKRKDKCYYKVKDNTKCFHRHMPLEQLLNVEKEEANGIT